MQRNWNRYELRLDNAYERGPRYLFQRGFAFFNNIDREKSFDFAIFFFFFSRK